MLSFWANFCPFIYPLNTWKTKILKKWRNAWRHYPFTNIYHNGRSYEVYISIYLYIYISMYRYKVWDLLPYSYLKYKVHKQKNRISLTYSVIVCNYPTPPHWQPEKSIFGKNEKIKYPAAFEKWTFWTNEKKKRFGIYVHFTHVYHKRKSIDVWFLRYEVWQAEFYFGSYFLLSLFLGLFSMPWDLPHQIFCLFKLFKLQVYSLYIHKILKKMLTWAEFKFMNYQLNDNGTFSPKKDNC